MKKFYIEFGPVILTGLGGGAANPVTVECYSYVYAKDFASASQIAGWVGQAQKIEVKHVSECDPSEPETEEASGDDELSNILRAN